MYLFRDDRKMSFKQNRGSLMGTFCRLYRTTKDQDKLLLNVHFHSFSRCPSSPFQCRGNLCIGRPGLSSFAQVASKGRLSEYTTSAYQANDSKSIADKSPYPWLLSRISSSPAAITWTENEQRMKQATVDNHKSTHQFGDNVSPTWPMKSDLDHFWKSIPTIP